MIDKERQTYQFNWENLEILMNGKSSLDATNYLSSIDNFDDAKKFLKGYGFKISDPVQSAELFGNFQEAMQFIRRFFLKEGDTVEGLNYSIPNLFYTITDIAELLMVASGKSSPKVSAEEELWANIILKVMHTILHADKDFRYQYFSTIQTQIFDRFYKYLHRDENEALFLRSSSDEPMIPLYDFQTKAKKTRESIIIKLLHKKENVAEELFDRIGVRIVTKDKVDVLRVMKFLDENYIVMLNNIKPSRSMNSLIDLSKLKYEYDEVIKQDIEIEKMHSKLESLTSKSLIEKNTNEFNLHSSDEYRAIHFTARQMIKYLNPFVGPFNEIRKLAQEENSKLAEKILNLDTTSITKEIRFFYPFEVQICDYDSYVKNTEGEASHLDYKKSQLRSARDRLFKPLLNLKGC